MAGLQRRYKVDDLPVLILTHYVKNMQDCSDRKHREKFTKHLLGMLIRPASVWPIVRLLFPSVRSSLVRKSYTLWTSSRDVLWRCIAVVPTQIPYVQKDMRQYGMKKDSLAKELNKTFSTHIKASDSDTAGHAAKVHPSTSILICIATLAFETA
jgi:hypothetical protein